jgi:transcriptional regulator with XRE-family HTH domain
MMKIKMSNALRAKLEAAKKTDIYWMGAAKLDFALAIEHQRKQVGKSYADVATAIGTSPAYISKVFRGDANLTIESMVKLARSLGCNLDLALKEISIGEIARPFQIQETRSAINRGAFAAFMAEEDGMKEGTFNLPDHVLQTSNDQIYQNAA